MVSFPAPLAIAGATELLEKGINTSNSISDSWDAQWLIVFQSPLYTSINQLALIVAVGALIFFVMKWVYSAVHDGDYSSPIRDLIWPIVVVTFLSNNALLLAQSTIALRGVIHETSQSVLDVTLLDVSLKQAVRAGIARGVVTSEVSAQVSQCQGMVGQDQIDCLQQAKAQVEDTLSQYESKWNIPVPPGLGLLVQGIAGAVQTASQENNVGSGAVYGTLGFLGGFFGGAFTSITQSLLLAFQWAFANTLEITMLLTGLLGPIAMAASLLPFPGKPIFAWLVTFVSFGMAQISYNIIIGLAATVMINSDVVDTNGFLVIIALLAPALALGLSAGGGMTIFNIILSGSTGAVAMLSTQGLRSVSSGRK